MIIYCDGLQVMNFDISVEIIFLIQWIIIEIRFFNSARCPMRRPKVAGRNPFFIFLYAAKRTLLEKFTDKANAKLYMTKFFLAFSLHLT